VPYKRKGNVIYHKKGGKWSVKQTCSSATAAKSALGLLYGLESGSIKREDVGKRRKK